MNIEAGQQIELNNIQYRVEKFLGSGAVSHAYLAFLAVETLEYPVVLKFMVEAAGADLELSASAMRAEVDTLSILNKAEDSDWPVSATVAEKVVYSASTKEKRVAVAVYDAGDTNSGKPFIVQEPAPERLEPVKDVTTALELEMLATLLPFVKLTAVAHDNNIALKDFSPNGSKWDRFRAEIDEANEVVDWKFIDWNISGDATEAKQDLMYWGGHLIYFLTGENPYFDYENPENLPLNLAGFVNQWQKISAGLRTIIGRALNKNASQRYQTAEQLESDLAWWHGALSAALDQDANTLQRLIRISRANENYLQAQLGSELALEHLELTPTQRSSYELYSQDASKKLENQIWLPIAKARASLARGVYEFAQREFKQQLRQLDPDSDVALAANLGLQTANFGLEVKSRGFVNTPDEEPMTSFRSATNALMKNDAVSALRAIAVVESHLGAETAETKYVQNYAQAIEIYTEITEDRVDIERVRPDVYSENWSAAETNVLVRLDELAEKYNAIGLLIPDNARLLDGQQAVKEQLRVRRNYLAEHQVLIERCQGLKNALTRLQGQQIGTLQLEQLETQANGLQQMYSELAANYPSASQRTQHVLQSNLAPLSENIQQKRQAFEHQAGEKAASHDLDVQLNLKFQAGLYSAANADIEVYQNLGYELSSEQKMMQQLALVGIDLNKNLKATEKVALEGIANADPLQARKFIQELDQLKGKYFSSLTDLPLSGEFAQLRFEISDELVRARTDCVVKLGQYESIQTRAQAALSQQDISLIEVRDLLQNPETALYLSESQKQQLGTKQEYLEATALQAEKVESLVKDADNKLRLTNDLHSIEIALETVKELVGTSHYDQLMDTALVKTDSFVMRNLLVFQNLPNQRSELSVLNKLVNEFPNPVQQETLRELANSTGSFLNLRDRVLDIQDDIDVKATNSISKSIAVLQQRLEKTRPNELEKIRLECQKLQDHFVHATEQPIATYYAELNEELRNCMSLTDVQKIENELQALTHLPATDAAFTSQLRKTKDWFTGVSAFTNESKSFDSGLFLKTYIQAPPHLDPEFVSTTHNLLELVTGLESAIAKESDVLSNDALKKFSELNEINWHNLFSVETVVRHSKSKTQEFEELAIAELGNQLEALAKDETVNAEPYKALFGKVALLATENNSAGALIQAATKRAIATRLASVTQSLSFEKLLVDMRFVDECSQLGSDDYQVLPFKRYKAALAPAIENLVEYWKAVDANKSPDMETTISAFEYLEANDFISELIQKDNLFVDRHLQYFCVLHTPEASPTSELEVIALPDLLDATDKQIAELEEIAGSEKFGALYCVEINKRSANLRAVTRPEIVDKLRSYLDEKLGIAVKETPNRFEFISKILIALGLSKPISPAKIDEQFQTLIKTELHPETKKALDAVLLRNAAEKEKFLRVLIQLVEYYRGT